MTSEKGQSYVCSCNCNYFVQKVSSTPFLLALSNIILSSSSFIFSPNSFDFFFNELKVIVSELGSPINKSNILLIPSFDSLSSNLLFIASKKTSKLIPPFLSSSGMSTLLLLILWSLIYQQHLYRKAQMIVLFHQLLHSKDQDALPFDIHLFFFFTSYS